jgi:hypothetical protein
MTHPSTRTPKKRPFLITQKKCVKKKLLCFLRTNNYSYLFCFSLNLDICLRQRIECTKLYLRAVYTRVFCVRFSVRDGTAAQLLPMRDHVLDRARKAKEAVGQWRHRRRRNGRKKRKCRRPFRRKSEKFRAD